MVGEEEEEEGSGDKAYRFQINGEGAREAFLGRAKGDEGRPARHWFGGRDAAGQRYRGAGRDVDVGVRFVRGGCQEFREHHAPVEAHAGRLVEVVRRDLREGREGEGVAGGVDDVGQLVRAVGGGEVEEGGQVALDGVGVREVAGEAGEVRGRGGGGAEAGDCGVNLGLAGAGDGEAGAAELQAGFCDGVADAWGRGLGQ